MQEETGRMVDRDEVIRLALERVQNSGILFVDEIDKICSVERSQHGPDVSREGVQRDLLPIIEGSAVATKYGLVRSDHILFIAAGAFHAARPSDLIPELQGRLPSGSSCRSFRRPTTCASCRNPAIRSSASTRRCSRPKGCRSASRPARSSA